MLAAREDEEEESATFHVSGTLLDAATRAAGDGHELEVKFPPHYDVRVDTSGRIVVQRNGNGRSQRKKRCQSISPPAINSSSSVQ